MEISDQNCVLRMCDRGHLDRATHEPCGSVLILNDKNALQQLVQCVRNLGYNVGWTSHLEPSVGTPGRAGLVNCISLKRFSEAIALSMSKAQTQKAEFHWCA